MATAVDPSPKTTPSEGTAFETKVSGYDVFQAMLTSLVVLVGFFALLLFLIWLTSVFTFRPRPAKITIPPDVKGRGAAAEGTARDLEEPGVEELPDVQEPQLSDALEAMTDAISTQKASFDAFEGNAAEMGSGKGQGDSRESGPGGEGDLDVIPPWKRWKIQFATANQADYAKQLDFLGVELGALSQNTTNIRYASNLSAASPRERSGTRENEPRLYFVHPSKDPLLAFTKGLLEKTKINTDDRLLAQFYSNEAYNLLLTVEKAGLGTRSLASVRRTIFGVRQAGSRYEFHVIRYEYLVGT